MDPARPRFITLPEPTIIERMTPDNLLRSRRDQWEALQQLLDRAARNLRRLSPAEIEQLGTLYRDATSDLALAQRDFPNDRTTQYLNQLVARAHALIYQGKPAATGRFWHFVRSGYPRLFRRHARFFIAALLLFFVPAVGVGLLTAASPEAARWALPPAVQQLIPQIEQQELWIDIPVADRPYASSLIATNNIQVSFLAFAGGVLAGLFTVYILISNGLLIGGILGLTVYHGVGFELLTFMVGHGVVELTVIFIAGGCGLLLGWALLRPGLLSRRDALQLAARDAVQLLSAAVPLLLVAGLIEGFVSPAENIPWPLKFAVGGASGLLLYAYLLLAGRPKDARAPSDPDSD